MNSTTPHLHSTRELAHRTNDGIDVTLYWHPDTDQLSVCVSDQRRGANFEIEPEPPNALDAFYHPYAYATLNPVHYADDRLAA
jgi:hypothetical protein